VGIPCPKVELPETFIVDDRMIIRPEEAGKSRVREIYRGPNIGTPPVNDPLPARIDGEVAIVVGDKITNGPI